MWANEVIGMNPNRPNDCYHNITTPEDFVIGEAFLKNP